LWIDRIRFQNIWLVYQSEQNLKGKEKVSTVAATDVVEEFIFDQLPLTKDDMVALI